MESEPWTYSTARGGVTYWGRDESRRTSTIGRAAPVKMRSTGREEGPDARRRWGPDEAVARQSSEGGQRQAVKSLTQGVGCSCRGALFRGTEHD